VRDLAERQLDAKGHGEGADVDWSLAAGVDLFTLSRRMGTSLAMLDATYGHLAPDADDRERVLLDAYDRAVRVAAR
jgi:hypothetical protein